MKIVMQRVNRASVSVVETGEVVGSIGKGVVILWGINRHDQWKDAEYCIRKALTSKLFNDPLRNNESWRRSVVDCGYELLVISQFTLFGDVTKGAKPDFHAAMTTEDARVMFSKIVEKLRKDYKETKIQTGSFGSYSRIDLEFDGPVTIIVDTDHKRLHNAPSNTTTGTESVENNNSSSDLP